MFTSLSRYLFLRNKLSFSEIRHQWSHHLLRPVSFATQQYNDEQTIYCNRPYTAQATIPTTLLHPVFGQFLDDCETHQVTADDTALAMELHIAMSNFYLNEWVRARKICRILRDRNLEFSIRDDDEREGSLSVHDHCYAIAEFRGEVDSMGAEPYNEATLYYLESTRDDAVTMGDSCFPCIMILFFGSYITFVGAAWNLRPAVQPLSFTALPLYRY